MCKIPNLKQSELKDSIKTTEDIYKLSQVECEEGYNKFIGLLDKRWIPVDKMIEELEKHRNCKLYHKVKDKNSDNHYWLKPCLLVILDQLKQEDG